MNNDWAYFGSNATGRKDQIEKLWSHIAQGKDIAVDIETVSLDDLTLIGWSIGISPNESFWFFPNTQYNPQLRWILENPNILKVFHNGSFDRPVLEKHLDITVHPHTDTMFMAQLTSQPVLNLADLSMELLAKPQRTIKGLLNEYKTKSMLAIPIEQVVMKCCNDTMTTLAIKEQLEPKVPPKAMDLELRVQPVIERMNTSGMWVDTDRLEEHIEITQKTVNILKLKCSGLGFNPGSSKQLASVLTKRGHSVKYNRSTGNPILPKETLRTRYGHDPVVKNVLEYRRLKSMLSTRLIGVRNKLVGSKLYIKFFQGGAVSGRISTSPNSQNIEYELRNIYVPSPGNILEVWDFSQIELRILAWLSQDPVMLDAFYKGLSIHKQTAKFMYGNNYDQTQYKLAKNINFTVIYLGDENTLYQRYETPLQIGKYFVNAWFQIYPMAKRWIEERRERVTAQGYAETYYGRRRDFDISIYAPEWHNRKCEREAVNHEIQGTAGEANKELLIWCDKQADIVNTVHDEVAMDIDLHQTVIMPSFNSILPLRTPIEGGRGFSWKEAKEDT